MTYYVVVNDEIGGFDVATSPWPRSSEMPLKEPQIAWGLTEANAEMIVRALNFRERQRGDDA